jgi:phosphoglycerol geranylgeranyltransferase
MDLLKHIEQQSLKGKKQFSVLIDPDKTHPESLQNIIELAVETQADYFFVGGSLLTQNNMEECIIQIKKNCKIPVMLFPGSLMQVTDKADAILLLSLISGRNADMLIGNHVIAAPILHKSSLEIIPTGYMLIESGKITSVLYMSNTTPIPFDKVDIAVCTAMAGEMLGLKTIYMDAGSGAIYPVPTEMIRAVKQSVNIPLIVGGGVRTAEDAAEIWEGGADILTVGNAAETRPEVIREIARVKQMINS